MISSIRKFTYKLPNEFPALALKKYIKTDIKNIRSCLFWFDFFSIFFAQDCSKGVIYLFIYFSFTLSWKNTYSHANVKTMLKSIYLTVSYYHATYEFQSESTLYSLPECQGTLCSKQVPYLTCKWQQRYSKLQPLSS